MTRGEGRARWMLARINEAGVRIRFSRKDGEWGVQFPEYCQSTPEQKEIATELILFGIAYPRCYGTLVRLHRDQGVAA